MKGVEVEKGKVFHLGFSSTLYCSFQGCCMSDSAMTVNGGAPACTTAPCRPWHGGWFFSRGIMDGCSCTRLKHVDAFLNRCTHP